jgi:hypothetical protein
MYQRTSSLMMPSINGSINRLRPGGEIAVGVVWGRESVVGGSRGGTYEREKQGKRVRERKSEEGRGGRRGRGEGGGGGN